MKSIIINDDELHKRLKLLSVRVDKNITELVETAIKEMVDKYERDSRSNGEDGRTS